MPQHHIVTDQSPTPVVLDDPSRPVKTAPGPQQRPGQVLQEALVSLRSARHHLSGDLPSTTVLARVADDLALAEEELTSQLAELETVAQARQQGHALARRLIEDLPVAVLTTTVDGAIVEANPAAEALLELPARRLRQRKPVFAYIDTGDRRAARDLLRSVNLGQDATDAVLTISPRTGVPVACRVVITRGPADRERAGRQWVIQPTRSGPEDPAVGARYRDTLTELTQLGVSGDVQLSTLLRRVADLSVRATPGARAASVVLGDPADPTVIVSTSPLAQVADGLQYMSGCGPIFNACASGVPVSTTDASDDERWPDLAGLAGTTGDIGAGRHWLATPLMHDERSVGVLMVYGHELAGDTAREVAPFVAAASTLVRDNETVQEMRRTQEQLQDALRSRGVIDQAKGMIMLTRRCSADEAFAVLVQMSNDSNRKIRDLAAEFVQEAVQDEPAGP